MAICSNIKTQNGPDLIDIVILKKFILKFLGLMLRNVFTQMRNLSHQKTLVTTRVTNFKGRNVLTKDNGNIHIIIQG